MTGRSRVDRPVVASGMPDPDAFLLTGGCLCGSVRFEITEPPFNAGYCHCTRCQRRTGTAASAQARIPPGALRVTSGQELVAAYAPGDGGFEKLFCSACGSALFSRHPERHEVMSVRLGALDEDPGLEMEWRQYRGLRRAVGADPRRRCAALPEARPERSALAGTRWRAERSAPGGEPPTLEFADPWRIAGSTGVNRYFGSYELPGDEIVFGLVGSTLMAGPEPAMRVERQFLAVLSGTQPVEIADGALRIGTGAEALRLTALD